jgi:hypothetical protein
MKILFPLLLILGLTASVPAAPARPAGARLPLLAELRDPQALRRAFVLREILGPAKGLQ